MLPIQLIGQLDCVGGLLRCSDWLVLMSRWVWLYCRQMSVRGAVVVCPWVFRIEYKRRVLARSSSLDAAPVTGSLLFYAPVCCLADNCAAEVSSWVLFGGTDCSWLAVCGLFLRRVSVTWVMATDSAAATGGRAGIMFDVELVVPWDAPEAVVDLHLDGVVKLDMVPDVLGLQGRDVQSVRALVPDPRMLELGFHDVTIVDMGDLPEPSVSMDELSFLRRQ